MTKQMQLLCTYDILWLIRLFPRGSSWPHICKCQSRRCRLPLSSASSLPCNCWLRALLARTVCLEWETQQGECYWKAVCRCCLFAVCQAIVSVHFAEVTWLFQYRFESTSHHSNKLLILQVVQDPRNAYWFCDWKIELMFPYSKSDFET